MAAINPFRFLSLPKELRLMVYEFIAAKKTHHRIRLGKPDEHHDLKYVRTTLSGIEILATCHQIYEEAIDILRCRLAAIKKSPLRIISTNHMHGLPDFNVIAMLDRVDATRLNCGNIRALPVAPAEELAARAKKLALCEKEPYDCRYAPLPYTTYIQYVSIAFRRTDSGWPSPLHSCVYQFESTLRALDENEHCRERRRLNVEIRPALLSAVTQVVARKMNHGYYVVHGSVVRTGVNIGEDEWRRDWEEGERYIY
jgi:hypothetical protein